MVVVWKENVWMIHLVVNPEGNSTTKKKQNDIITSTSTVAIHGAVIRFMPFRPLKPETD